jgi:hypothetical protein
MPPALSCQNQQQQKNTEKQKRMKSLATESITEMSSDFYYYIPDREREPARTRTRRRTGTASRRRPRRQTGSRSSSRRHHSVTSYRARRKELSTRVQPKQKLRPAGSAGILAKHQRANEKRGGPFVRSTRARRSLAARGPPLARTSGIEESSRKTLTLPAAESGIASSLGRRLKKGLCKRGDREREGPVEETTG